MTITIKQREAHQMSHESQGLGLQLWDVYQGDALVGVYRSESEALGYKVLLESGRLNQLHAASGG